MRGTLVALLLAAVPGAAREEPAAPRVVFLSERGAGERDGVYLMNADGSGLRRLVDPKRDVMHQACAPGGGRLAFVCDPEGDEMFELFVLGVGDGAEERIGSGICWYPAWSPGGGRLAYMNHTSGWRVRFTNPAGAVARPPQSHVGGDGAPSWSPDGRTLALQSNRDGNLELYLADARTGAPRRLTDTPVAETRPRFSPDGTRIAYLREGDVWTIAPDGSGATNLTRSEAAETDVAWSPDGARLAVVRERDILLLDPGTRGTTVLTRNGHSPAWSPDGKRLLFVSDRDGNEEIYVMRADGSGVARLTDHPERDHAPEWLPE